jgi:DNA-3-methyladenine glycosylase I
MASQYGSDHGPPPQIEPQSLSDYLDVMSKSVFQSGMSWRVVESKWETTREAFEGFDPVAVAAFGDAEIDRLVEDTRVIRNRRKLQAVAGNAARMTELEAEHGSFRDYLHSHDGFEETVADLRKQFSFIGETGCYIFLYVVGEPVPPHDEWEAARKKR